MGVADPSQASGRAQAAPGQPQPAQVRASWLLGALGLLLLAALCCAYLSLCLLFAQGQWQLLYHPAQAALATPASAGLAFTPVRFGPTDAGQSQLSGWWLPAPPSSPLRATTVLYLHGATGSLSDTVPALARLHALGCAVFAIDYRGYGSSARQNPSEERMVEDAARALVYLVDTRHLAPGSIVLWGRGIGATVAAEAAHAQPDPASLRLVIEDANLPALELLRQDGRSRLLPVRLLLRDRLDAGSVLAASSAPKLFLDGSADGNADAPTHGHADPNVGTTRLYLLAASPKERARAREDAAVQRFLAGGPVRFP